MKMALLVTSILFYGQEFSDAMNIFNMDNIYDNWEQFMFFESLGQASSQFLLKTFATGLAILIALLVPSMELLAAIIGTFAVLFYNILIPISLHTIMVLNTEPRVAAKLTLNAVLLLLSGALFFGCNIYFFIQLLSNRQYFQYQ